MWKVSRYADDVEEVVLVGVLVPIKRKGGSHSLLCECEEGR
jgi:hypothetical protein